MQQIRAVVAREFEQVNQLIIDQLRSNVPMVENVGHYIVDAGGKRLRPLLVLLSAACLGSRDLRQVTFAAVIEFIHTATLLHDDVVDISSLRRGRATANAEFGNAPSVLVGDFLYTRAFQLMVQLEDMDILHHMADTTNVIAEGEVLQLTRAGDANTSEAQYLDVITRKTAVLFAAACRGAASLAGADASTRESLHQYGLNLGIAFQMIDDVLDYEGDPEATGKNIGDDLAEGKPTLPLIHAMAEADAAGSAVVRRAIEQKSASEIEAVLAAVRATDALAHTRRRATEYQDRALAQLSRLPDGEALQALTAIARLAVDRDR